MKPVNNPQAELEWLRSRPAEEAMTGYDQAGWDASTWILHAMYNNAALDHLGSHDDIRKSAIAGGFAKPLIIGDVNLDETTTVTGAPLGFVLRPGLAWERITWRNHLESMAFQPDPRYPPCDRWFPHRSRCASLQRPGRRLPARRQLAAAHEVDRDHLRARADRHHAARPAPHLRQPRQSRWRRPLVIQEAMGHESITTTARIYAHLYVDELDTVAAALDRIAHRDAHRPPTGQKPATSWVLETKKTQVQARSGR